MLAFSENWLNDQTVPHLQNYEAFEEIAQDVMGELQLTFEITSEVDFLLYPQLHNPEVAQV